MPYDEQVLVITKLAPVKFNSLDEALNSSVAEYDDVAYENFDHFVKSTTPQHIQRLIMVWNLDVSRDRDFTSEDTKREVWKQLIDMSLDESQAKANKTLPTGDDQPEPKKDEKQQPEAKPEPQKAKPASKRGGTRRKWDDEDQIYLKVQENPKRGKARDRFALYQDGMTVRDYINAGGSRTDVNWDERHGLIEVRKAKKDG